MMWECDAEIRYEERRKSLWSLAWAGRESGCCGVVVGGTDG